MCPSDGARSAIKQIATGATSLTDIVGAGVDASVAFGTTRALAQCGMITFGLSEAGQGIWGAGETYGTSNQEQVKRAMPTGVRRLHLPRPIQAMSSRERPQERGLRRRRTDHAQSAFSPAVIGTSCSESTRMLPSGDRGETRFAGNTLQPRAL